MMKKSISSKELTNIGDYLLTGMTIQESCVLTGVDHEDLIKAQEQNEEVRSFIEKKKIKFKYHHLKEMQAHRSEKTSQWL